MSVIRISARYAKSLLELAVEQSNLESVLADVQALNEACKNRDLHLMLKSPIIHGTKKMQVLNALFEKNFNPVTMAFLKLITGKGREMYIPEIAAEFIEQYKIRNSITTVKLITATPVDQATVDNIHSKLIASNETGKKVEIVTVIDPQLIGGYILELGGKRYDSSVAYQLEQLRKEFKGNVYKKEF
jgi:F-type H+-transporting ATPase subunit delta